MARRCEDCIHDKVCNMWAMDSGIPFVNADTCEHYTADVVPKSEEGAECPTCHGTGRIGTTDWLTKGLSKKQLAEEKAKAIAEHEQHIKTEVAREIFEEVKTLIDEYFDGFYMSGEFMEIFDKLKKKYTEKIQ